LLTGVWLADQKCIDVYAKSLGIFWVESVLGIDEGGNATISLSVSNGVQGDGGLARRLWTINLYDSAAWKPAYAQGNVKRN
jgi:hypothetical protein